MNDGNIIIVNTDGLSPPIAGDDLWTNRLNAYDKYNAPGVPLASIYVLGYNRLQKTKYAVECVLKYTADIDYELILIDNGSTDGTLEFFKSVPHENKVILRVTNNIGNSSFFPTVLNIFKGKYLVAIPNDVYVTQNWLSNLLKCFESDPKIGFIASMSSNVSNLQQVDLPFSNFEQMQEQAAAFNKSDPAKWDERMRLIPLLGFWKRDQIDMVGSFDPSFIHDFSEDDLCARIRRMGYKVILCGDTWVHHDHDFRNLEDKDPQKFQASLESGRAMYREKYHGIDAWDDINNFEVNLLSPVDKHIFPDTSKLSALCVDVRCGTPVLEIRNRLRRRGITNVSSHACTTKAKYFLDLQTTGAEVVCDRIEYIQEHYPDGSLDIVALGEPVNTYPQPMALLRRLYDFLKPGGLLLFKVRNTDDFNTLLRTAGMGGVKDGDLPVAVHLSDVVSRLQSFGADSISIVSEIHPLGEQDRHWLENQIKKFNPNATDRVLAVLMTKDFVLKAVKQ